MKHIGALRVEENPLSGLNEAKMNQEKSLSITDIARELNFGIVTLKFILKRFRPWLSFERIDGHHYYSRNTILS